MGFDVVLFYPAVSYKLLHVVLCALWCMQEITFGEQSHGVCVCVCVCMDMHRSITFFVYITHVHTKGGSLSE